MALLVDKPDEPRRWWRLVLYSMLSVYAAAFLLFAETWAFGWDETYHLLAAQLILAGRTPYFDFCFPQTLLNAYWNAGWMSVFGQSWHVPQTVAAVLTIGAVLLTADFVARRFPVTGWRVPGAIVVGLMTGLNTMVFFYGPLGQPYGMCLCTLVLAFRICVQTPDRSGMKLPACAGFFAGIAAGSSLLSAAAAPALLAWILVYNRAGNRWRKLAGFALGAAIPFLPLLWFFAKAPRETWFNVFEYHVFFRKLYWPETTQHDLEVLTSWIDSGQALVAGLLAVFGLLYVIRRSSWPRAVKAQFYLAAWLAVALAAEVARAHPTFPQYFLLIVPFVAILAVAGLCALAERLIAGGRPAVPVSIVALLIAFGLVKAIYNRRDEPKWQEYERLAIKVNQVTPTNAMLFAHEPIYFLTRRVPPPGHELYYSHKVNLPAPERARLHILTEAEVKQQVQSGTFATAVSCDDDEINHYGLETVYTRRVDVADCAVFWDRKRNGPGGSAN
jgi:hypothetical protein